MLETFLLRQKQKIYPKHLLPSQSFFNVGNTRHSCTQHEYLRVGTYVYLALPNLIFLGTWLQPCIGIPFIIALSYTINRSVQNKMEKNGTVQFTKSHLLFYAILALLLTWYVGIGNFQPQVVDYEKHHAVLRDLLLKNWPVTYTNHPFISEPVFLDYYLAWYLSPVFLAKLTSASFVELFVLIWSSIGLFLGFCWFVRIAKLKRFWWVLLLLFFGDLENVYGLLKFLGRGIIQGDYNVGLFLSELYTGDIIFDNRTPSYATFLTQYEWAPQHTLPMLLATPLLLQNLLHPTKSDASILTLGLTLLWSPFVALGLLPLVLLILIKNTSSIFSIANVLGILLCLLFSSYYLAHLPQPIKSIWEALPHINFFVKYPIFILVKFGIISLLVFFLIRAEQDYKYLLFLAVIVLAIFPLIFIGKNADFAMRATGPAWYSLIFLVAKAMQANISLKLKYALVFIVMLCCFRYYFNGSHRVKKRYGPSVAQAETLTLINKQAWFNTQYFGKVDSFFYKYLAKKP